MTKQIRIENADTSSFKVQVKVQHKDAAGNWIDVPGETGQLPHPTNMVHAYITSHRRLIVEEVVDTPTT